MQQELFLCDEVLHMSVDNLVERAGRGRVNSAKFNTMMRIAQFWCNAQGAVTEDTEMLAEKHNFLAVESFEMENFCKLTTAKRILP